MATQPSPNPNDNALNQLLQGGSAGNDTTSTPSTPSSIGGFGVQGAIPGQNPLDTAGNEIVTVGKVQVSIDPRVRAADPVLRQGTTTIQVPSTATLNAEDANGAISKTPPKSTQTVQKQSTVEQTIQEEAGWSATQYSQFKQQAINAGLVSTKNPSAAEVAQAWAMVVQEASLQGKTPEELMTTASTSGWSAVNPTLMPTDFGLSGAGGASNTSTNGTTTTNSSSSAATTTHTSYISYMDPATVQGALADAYYRLMGRNPTSAEYQAFLNQVYGYENQANTGKFESGVVLKQGQTIDQKTGQVVDSKTGAPVPEADITRIDTNNDTADTSTTTQQSIVSQRGIGTRGVQFLAGQAAMSDPSYGQYQAATTYFHALQSALGAPGAGMQASGPTVTAP